MTALSWRVVDELQWNAALSTLDGACQEQDFTFARRRWPGAVLEPVLFEAGGKLVGGTLMVLQRLPFGVGTIAVCKWGPLLVRGHPPGAGVAMVEALQHNYAARRGMTLSMQPPIAPGLAGTHAETLRGLGFETLPDPRPTQRYLVDVRQTDAEIRHHLQQKWRNRLNKAERSGLTFERGTAAGFDEFDALFQQMLVRKGYDDTSAYTTARHLLEHRDERLRAELFLVRRDSIALAGAIVYKAGDMATYLYGATSTQALPFSAGHYLQFEIIRWLRDHTRAVWYNLGGSDGVAGLETFKTGLVGTRGSIVPLPPPMIFASNPLARQIGRAAFTARAWLAARRRRSTPVMPSTDNAARDLAPGSRQMAKPEA